MYAKLSVQNKTLTKINLNYLLITPGLVHMKYTVIVTYQKTPDTHNILRG